MRPRTLVCPVPRSIQWADEAPGQPRSGRSRPHQGLSTQTRRSGPPGGQQREGRPNGPPTDQNQCLSRNETGLRRKSQTAVPRNQCLSRSETGTTTTDQQQQPRTADRNRNPPLYQTQCLSRSETGTRQGGPNAVPRTTGAAEATRGGGTNGTTGTQPRRSTTVQRPKSSH